MHCFPIRMEPGLRIALLGFVLCKSSEASVRRQCTRLAFVSGESRRELRSFAVEKVIPPLSRVNSFSNSTAALSCAELADSIPVMYTNSPNVVHRWLSDHLPSKGCTLGFDVESVPVTPWMKGRTLFDGPATVQLSTVDAALVVHLTRPSGIPSQACSPILEAVLKDESFVKAGVGCDQDMLELYRWCNGALEARSRFELGSIRTSTSTGSPGLKALAKIILGIDLVKSRRLALSNWSQVPLTDAQLAYCSRDAWAGAAIMATLAKYDPETFGTRNIVSMLQSQRSLRDLNDRSVRRKSVKMQLTDILAPYRLQHRKSAVPPELLPEDTRQHVAHLNDIVKELAPEKQELYDIEHLGFQ